MTDLRADRQPEHTQIDVELSFATQDDVFTTIEQMLTHAFREAAGIELAPPFPRLRYREAMDRFGIDKPDTRFGLELFDASAVFAQTGFNAFGQTLKNGGSVRGLTVTGGSFSRKQLDDLTEMAKGFGAKGLAWLVRGSDAPRGPIAKFLSATELDSLWGVAAADR